MLRVISTRKWIHNKSLKLVKTFHLQANPPPAFPFVHIFMETCTSFLMHSGALWGKFRIIYSREKSSLTEKDSKKNETFPLRFTMRTSDAFCFVGSSIKQQIKDENRTYGFICIWYFPTITTCAQGICSEFCLVLKNNFLDTKTKSVRKFTSELNSKLFGNLRSSSR